jgi:hypothetical protein
VNVYQINSSPSLPLLFLKEKGDGRSGLFAFGEKTETLGPAEGRTGDEFSKAVT